MSVTRRTLDRLPNGALRMTDVHVDALVIGSGQGGGPLAGALARAGRRTVLVERRHIGGTCINEGCTPTKTMIASARVAYLAKRALAIIVLVGVQPSLIEVPP